MSPLLTLTQDPHFNPVPDSLFYSLSNESPGGASDTFEIWEDMNGKDILIDQIHVM